MCAAILPLIEAIYPIVFWPADVDLLPDGDVKGFIRDDVGSCLSPVLSRCLENILTGDQRDIGGRSLSWSQPRGTFT